MLNHGDDEVGLEALDAQALGLGQELDALGVAQDRTMDAPGDALGELLLRARRGRLGKCLGRPGVGLGGKVPQGRIEPRRVLAPAGAQPPARRR